MTLAYEAALSDEESDASSDVPPQQYEQFKIEFPGLSPEQVMTFCQEFRDLGERRRAMQALTACEQ